MAGCGGSGATIAPLDAAAETSIRMDGGAVDATNPQDTGAETTEAQDSEVMAETASLEDSNAGQDMTVAADTSTTPDTSTSPDTSTPMDSSGPMDAPIVDSSLPDTATMPDTAMAPDAGCVVPPMGQPCDPGVVECGGSACAVPASFCCASSGDANVASEMCVAAGGACSGLEEKCNEKADCPGSEVCCLVATSLAQQGISISCQPVCTGGLFSIQVCKSDTECPGG